MIHHQTRDEGPRTGRPAGERSPGHGIRRRRLAAPCDLKWSTMVLIPSQYQYSSNPLVCLLFCLSIIITHSSNVLATENTPPVTHDSKYIKVAHFSKPDNVPTEEYHLWVDCNANSNPALVLNVTKSPKYGSVIARPRYYYARPNAGGTMVQRRVMMFSYEPNAGHTGSDQFSYTISDGALVSNEATCRILVRTPTSRTDLTVGIIVDSNVASGLAPEMDRLTQDLVAEGFTPWRITFDPRQGQAALRAALQAKYHEPDTFLSGVILVGNLPYSRCTSWSEPYHVGVSNTDRGYMTLSGPDSRFADIWVSRMQNPGHEADDVKIIRRQLDANHWFRTGQMRLPRRAFLAQFYALPLQKYIEQLGVVWRDPAWQNQGFKVGSSGDGVEEIVRQGALYLERTHHGPSQPCRNGPYMVPFTVATTCGSAQDAQWHLGQRGGCAVFATGDWTVPGANNAWAMRFHPGPDQFLDYGMGDWTGYAVAEGDFLGSVKKFEVPSRVINFGDMSLRLDYGWPGNAMPVIPSFTRTPSGNIVPGQPVTFSVSVTDADATTRDNPDLPFEHQIEWFMNGWNLGKNEPTYTTSDNQGAGWTQVTHAFTTAGIYTVRAEVMDEWRARAWRDLSITVNTPPNAVNDTATTEAGHAVTIAVLANDSDPDGQTISLISVTDPPHGKTAISGTTVIYTPDAGYTGNDNFTYTIRDTLGGTATATVNVTVTSDVTPPRIQEVFSYGSLGTVKVFFDEPVAAGSGSGGAENPANYALDRGLGITGASLDGNLHTVTLNVTPSMTFGTTYTLTVNHVTDRATVPNPIAPNTRVSFTCVDYEPGVAYWAMEEPAWNGVVGEVRDRCAGACHGQAQGNAITGAGRVGRAGWFTGGRVTIPDAPRLRLGGTHSLACWVRVDVGNTSDLGLVGKGGGTNALNYLLCLDNKGAPKYAFRTAAGVVEMYTKTYLVAGSGWHHLAATCDGSVGVLYLDGKEIGRKSMSGTPLTSSAPVTLGGSQSFTGGLDEVRLFDRALSAEEIAALVQTQNTPPTCSITAPTDGATFTAPATLTITADAADSDGTIAKVEFFQGTTKLGEDTTSPYSYAWNNVAAGAYTLTVKATDNGGAVTTSAAVAITVQATQDRSIIIDLLPGLIWNALEPADATVLPPSGDRQTIQVRSQQSTLLAPVVGTSN